MQACWLTLCDLSTLPLALRSCCLIRLVYWMFDSRLPGTFSPRLGHWDSQSVHENLLVGWLWRRRAQTCASCSSQGSCFPSLSALLANWYLYCQNQISGMILSFLPIVHLICCRRYSLRSLIFVLHQLAHEDILEELDVYRHHLLMALARLPHHPALQLGLSSWLLKSTSAYSICCSSSFSILSRSLIFLYSRNYELSLNKTQ